MRFSSAASALLALILLSSCARERPPLRGTVLAFAPAKVELTGVLTMEVRYGPPNFGEDTLTDRKQTIPVLTLAQAVSVQGDSTRAANRSSVSGVTKVQLEFLNDSPGIQSLVNSRVVVTGTLSQAVAAGEFTPVVLHVLELRRAP